MAVEFNEPPSVISSRAASSRRSSSLSALIIKTGIVKTDTGAQIVLFIIAVLAFAGAVYFFNSSQKLPPAPTYDQIQP